MQNPLQQCLLELSKQPYPNVKSGVMVISLENGRDLFPNAISFRDFVTKIGQFELLTLHCERKHH